MAKAGYWKVESVTTSDGKTTYPDEDSFDAGHLQDFPDSRRSWTGGTYEGVGSVGSMRDWGLIWTAKPGAKLSMSDAGSAKAIFVWVAANQYGTPDDSEPTEWVFAQVSITASAQARSVYASHEDGGTPPEDIVSVSASNGFGTAPVEKHLSVYGEERSADASITTTRVLQVASNGQSSVEVPLPAASAVATATGGPNSGQAAVSSYVRYWIRPDFRGLSISSYIETSYYKQGGATPPDLPEGRFRPSTPKDGPGPWAIMHERPKSGRSMSVTSALQPGAPYVGFDPDKWYGVATLYAIEPGYEEPRRTWELSSGTSSPTGDLVDPAVNIVFQATGSATSTRPQPGSSNVTLTTFETAPKYGSTPSLGSESTYTIDWHAPYENWHPVSQRQPAGWESPVAGRGIDATTGAEVSVMPPRFDTSSNTNVLTFKVPKYEVHRLTVGDRKDSLNTLSFSYYAAGSIVTILAGLASAGSAGSLALIAALLGIGGSGASYVSGTLDETRSIEYTADWSRYKSDMRWQKQANDNSYGSIGEPIRCNDPDFVNQAVAEIENSGDDPQNASLFRTHARYSATAQRQLYQDVYEGDHYDANGYTGLAEWSDVYPASDFDFACVWSQATGSTPPVGGM